MREKIILVKNVETNYKVFGNQGLPFLILHGWGSDSGRWQKVGELLSQNNLKVVVPDLPGFGKSQQPEKIWGLDNYAEWLNEFSQKIPALSKGFYLLGHSFGGSLAVKFAIKYNQKVEKLFLVSAALIRKKTASKKVFSNVAKVFKTFSFLPFYQLIRKSVYKFIFRKSDYPYVQGVMKYIYLKTISQDLSCHLPFVKVPTIIIWGDKDTLTPVKNAYLVNKKIENSKLIIIKNADHFLNVKVSEVLSQKILDNI